MSLPEKFFVIDFENTGGGLDRGHKVTAVGLVIVEKVNGEYEITQRYSTFVNPERRIEPFIERLIGIKTREVNSDKYPKIDKVFDELLNIFGSDKIFVAHCLGVDYGMFNYLYKQKFGEELKCYGMDTHKLSRKLLGNKKNSIGNLYVNYFEKSRHHQPDFDAEVAGEVLKESLQKIENENLDLKEFIIPLPKNNKEEKRKRKEKKRQEKLMRKLMKKRLKLQKRQKESICA